MAYAITNENLQTNVPGLIIPNIGSTQNQVLGTSTTTSTSLAAPRWEFGDYTSTQAWIPATTQIREGGIGDFQYAHNAFRALVYLKSVTGSASATSTFSFAGSVVTLECATSTAGFVGTGSTGSTLSSYIIDSKILPQSTSTSTGQTYTVYLFGQTPLTAGCQYARVGFYPISGATVSITSTALDAVIEGL